MTRQDRMRKWLLFQGLLIIGFCHCLIAQQQGPEEKAVFDKDIKPVHVEKLAYPALARQARIQGVVVVRAKLDSQGKVVSSSGISGHPLLIKECVSNAMRWEFQPNPDHVAVIIYDFRLEVEVCPKKFCFRPPNIVTITADQPVVNP